MKVVKTGMEGLVILEPKIMRDTRGYFFEAYNKKTFGEADLDTEFVQDNQSKSSRGVLRGLHFQKPPYAQTKLVRVLKGLIQDVVVDLRASQPTFGKYLSVELSAEDGRQLLIPRGFAHGFLVLSDEAEVFYKCDEYYHPEAEGGVHYGDPALAISWGIPAKDLLVSNRDKELKSFTEVVKEFTFD